MKRVLLFLLLLSGISWAQVSPQITGAGAPSNPCANGGQQYLDTTNHLLYNCSVPGANWVLLGTGSGGSVTKSSDLTSGNIVKATGAATIANSSHIDTGAGLQIAEAAAPSGVAASDIIYADSTAHRWVMNNNNGGAVNVVASGVDINNSDQVTATHLAAALPEAQGGTGAAALTCTNQFLTSNGTAYSCSTPTLSGAQFANQGTTTTVLHGNAAGNPSFGSVVNADIAASTIDLTAKVTGTLPAGNGGTGNAFFAVSGPATSTKTFTFQNATSNVFSLVGASVANTIYKASDTSGTVLAASSLVDTGTTLTTSDGTLQGPSGATFTVQSQSGQTLQLASTGGSLNLNDGTGVLVQINNTSGLVGHGFRAAVTQFDTYENATNTATTFQSGLDATTTGASATALFKAEDVNGGSTASLSGGAATIRAGDNASSGATETAGALTVRGGDTTNASSAVNVAGAVTIRGGNTASSSTSGTAGSVTIQPGACTAAAVSAACNGTVKLLQAFFTTGTATVHSLACVTATNTVATCTSAANGTNAIGWIDSVSGNTVYVQMGAFGQVVTGLALSATFTAGQWACADTTTTAGDVVPSATKCAAGLPGGVVLTTATTTNPVFIVSQTL